jgi:hypothetical protein
MSNSLPIAAPDRIIYDLLAKRAETHGIPEAQSTAQLIIGGALRFIIETGGEAVARDAVSEMACALELAIAFNHVEETGMRQ